MKVLRLTTSNDTVISGPGSRVERIQRLASERLGEPVEVVSKAVWPDARLAAAVERWIEKEQPDVVWMLVQNFWFEYLSVPKKLERHFGRAGKLASDAGFRAAEVPWLARTAGFRALRRLLQRTIGGDAHFTVDELYETVEAVARISLRAEGRQFVVWGPFSYTNYAVTRRQTETAMRKRAALIARIRRLAGELHFFFEAPERPLWETQRMRLHSDQFHFAREEQEQMAEREAGVLERLWREAGALTPGRAE